MMPYTTAGDLSAVEDFYIGTTNYTYDAFGNCIRVTDPRGNSTQYTYDANNNRTSVTDALGNVTTYEYDACNQLVKETDAKNHSILYGYDACGRRISVTDAKGNTIRYTYDGVGNVTTVTDAKGNIISSTVYNSLNLPSSVTDAAGKSTEYTYNSLGKVATITDPLNQVKTFEYNSRGQNVKVTDPLNGVSTAAYNAFGKVTALTGPTGAATNYTYDNLGRLTAETTSAGGSIEYGYNELHLRNEITNGRDQTHTLQYDMSGRIYSRVTPEGTIRYTYDGCNNITKVVGPNGTINRTFDKLNRVTSYTDALGKTVQYQYDAVGNLVKLIYPDNTAVTYAYDANHNLISVTDWEDRITTYTYDVNNKVTSIAKWDESVTSYTYDDAQRLISYTVCDYLNDVIVGYEYTYDHLGRIIMEKDLVKELQMSYTYDELSRVIKRSTYDLTDPEGEVEEETFAYDLAGNLTDDAGNATFTYGTNNRLTAYNNTAISYDLDGNMLNVGAMNCTYDSSNRLTAAGALAYTYDAENTRIRSVNGTVETTYTYDVNARLSRLLMKTTGDEVKKYIYGLGLLYEDDGSDFLTYHFDLRGSTVAISDDSGMIVDTFEYDTYGKLLGHFGGTDTPFLYNGRDGVMTEANGLYYMRNRYYSPDLRRFINADVIAGELTNAVTMNRYAYANANPVMCIDPFGLSADNIIEDTNNSAISILKALYESAYAYYKHSLTEGIRMYNANHAVMKYIMYNYHTVNDKQSLAWSVITGAVPEGALCAMDSLGYQEIRNGLLFYDPASGTQIDFLHLIATTCAYTSDNMMLTESLNNKLNSYAGWAGDLITLAGEIQAHLWEVDCGADISTLVEDCLKGEMNSTFSPSDFIGDVDAISLSMLLNDMPIYQAFSEYYSSGYKSRYTNFVGHEFSGDVNMITKTAKDFLEPGFLTNIFKDIFDADYDLLIVDEVAEAFSNFITAQF